MVVELSTRKSEIRGDGENHHEKLGLERISCGSQLTIPDMASTSPDPVGNITDTGSSTPNQASVTGVCSLSNVIIVSDDTLILRSTAVDTVSVSKDTRSKYLYQ